MDTVELLQKFADPEVIKSLTLAQKMTAGLITTVLGMGITIISLVILQFVIGVMARLTSAKTPPAEERQPAAAVKERAVTVVDPEIEEELVAAITTALALQLRTAASNIVIRNIERVETPVTAWHRAGITEQMNNSR